MRKFHGPQSLYLGLGAQALPVGSDLTPLGPLTLYKLLRPSASSAIQAIEVPMLGKDPGCNRLSGLRLPRPLLPNLTLKFALPSKVLQCCLAQDIQTLRIQYIQYACASCSSLCPARDPERNIQVFLTRRQKTLLNVLVKVS